MRYKLSILNNVNYQTLITVGYMVQSVVTSNNPKITRVFLRWNGEKISLFSKPEDIITNVTVEIHELTNNMLRIKVNNLSTIS